jgi:hypothetical protein
MRIGRPYPGRPHPGRCVLGDRIQGDRKGRPYILPTNGVENYCSVAAVSLAAAACASSGF